MAFKKSVALCLLLTLTSGLCRPLSVDQSAQRTLLQAVSAADAFANIVANGGSSADIQAAFQKMVSGGTPPQVQQAALSTALLTTKANPAVTNNLATAIADTSKSNPGLATSIGSVVAGATGTPNTGNTATSGDATAILKVVSSGGVSQGAVTAIAQAQASATNAIATAVATAIAIVDGKKASAAQVTAAAQACAQAIGTACATAITSVTAKGSVSGSGTVTGAGASNAAAYAKAFSLATADAFALAKNGKNQAVGVVQSVAYTSAVADVCSKAEAAINLQGRGTTETSVTAIASSFQTAISTAIASAVAFVGGVTPPTTG